MDVPFQVAVPPPSIADVMLTPGASRSRPALLLEKPATVSELSKVAPTATAPDRQAGALIIRSSLPILPAYTPTWVIVVVLCVAMLTGIVFSVLPARNAARLDPVLALARR